MEINKTVGVLLNRFGVLGKRLIVLGESIQQLPMALDIFRMIVQRFGFFDESVVVELVR